MFNTQEEVKEYLIMIGCEDTTVFECSDYCTAFIGTDLSTGRAIYEYDLMIKHLMNREGMSQDEAIEWIDYNTLGALPSIPNAPIILRKSFF